MAFVLICGFLGWWFSFDAQISKLSQENVPLGKAERERRTYKQAGGLKAGQATTTGAASG